MVFIFGKLSQFVEVVFIIKLCGISCLVSICFLDFVQELILDFSFICYMNVKCQQFMGVNFLIMLFFFKNCEDF